MSTLSEDLNCEADILDAILDAMQEIYDQIIILRAAMTLKYNLEKKIKLKTIAETNEEDP